MQPFTPRTLRAGLVAVMLACAGPALALDTTLDDVRLEQMHDGVKATLAIKRIDIVGANLTKDELTQLFSPGLSDEARKALAARLSASRISAPELVATNGEGTFTMTDLLAENIDRGKIGHMAIAGLSGDFPAEKGGRATLKSGPFVLDGGDLSPLLTDGVTAGLAPTSHMSWTGLEITVPDEDMPAGKGDNLIRITMDSFVADSTTDGTVPLTATARLDHLRIVPAPGSDMATGMQAAGYEQVDIGLTMAGSYDPATRIVTLQDYTLTGAKAGALSVQGTFTDVDKAVFSGKNEEKMAALMKGAIATLKLSYADAGLFDKALAIYAAQEGKTPAEVKAQWSAMASQFIPLVLGGAPGSLNVAKAISGFIARPQTLTITAKAKGAPLRFEELSRMKDPSGLIKRVELDGTSGAR